MLTITLDLHEEALGQSGDDEEDPILLVEWKIKQVMAVVKWINENRPPRPAWISNQYPLTVL